MQAFSVPSYPRVFRLASRRSVRGLTLVETIIAIGILALATMGGVATFYQLNRYAANLRNMSMARALCQERFEQAASLAFRPSASVVPSAPSADPVNTANRTILGAATSYNSTGSFTGGANYQTSTETIPVYTQSTGTAAAHSANVTYTRVSNVTQAPLYSATASQQTATSLYIMEFTVTVTYTFRGQTYTTSMSTMRSPD
jgi:type II secretory pathway pseudopilin PulG